MDWTFSQELNDKGVGRVFMLGSLEMISGYAGGKGNYY